MVQVPDSHFEIKPRRDVVDSLSSEYTDDHSPYHPPGSVPTPVLIAQKIAENKPGGSSNLLQSSLQRCQSMESERPKGYSSDPAVKQGPPTSAKPTRFPANISVIHSNKDHQNQPGANVNIYERRSQMLANLAGTSHHLLQENSQQAADQSVRNTPARSISFRDPTPDISRMEALSKLGLNRSRALSGSMPPPNKSTTLDPLPGSQPSVKPLEASVPPTTEASTKASVTPPTQSLDHVDRKPEMLQTDSFRRHQDGNPQPSPSPSVVTKSSFNPPLEHKAPVIPQSSLELNSYGGKSIVVFPKNEPATSPTSPDPKIISHSQSNPSEFNTYGGKSKVMTPAPGSTMRHDLPDILSSHIDKSQTLPAKSEPLNTGGKSRTFNPSTGGSSEVQTKTFKAPAPTPAPKPHRHTIHAAPSKAAQRPPSPEHRRRSVSMFRPQGITVQFSGRGPMNESRRDALRKLGLLKDSWWTLEMSLLSLGLWCVPAGGSGPVPVRYRTGQDFVAIRTFPENILRRYFIVLLLSTNPSKGLNLTRLSYSLKPSVLLLHNKYSWKMIKSKDKFKDKVAAEWNAIKLHSALFYIIHLLNLFIYPGYIICLMCLFPSSICEINVHTHAVKIFSQLSLFCFHWSVCWL